MKPSIILSFAMAFSVIGCRPGSEEGVASDANKTDPPPVVDTVSSKPAATADDGADISDCLKGFYRWYARYGDSARAIDFIDDRGEHLALDRPRLETYMAYLHSSGYLSRELLDNETRFYEACERLWGREEKDEVPSGLSADRFHCAQDYIAPYESGDVTAVVEGDRAKATLTLSGEMGEKSAYTFDMKREAGVWRIARLGCDSGVPY